MPSAVAVYDFKTGKYYSKTILNAEKEAADKVLEYSFEIPSSMQNPMDSLQISVKNFGKIPEGKQGAGYGAWLFVDEIIVNNL